MVPTICVLTFNSEGSVAATIAAAKLVSTDIVVVDSGSTDATLEILRSLSVQVLHHPFENYGAQRNWAIELLNSRAEWQLHLDADEVMSPELIAAIQSLSPQVSQSGFLVARYLRFMGKLLKHNLAPTYHMRLFRSGSGKCEARMYDQHFICDGPTADLAGFIVDDLTMSLSEWTRRHNNWSDAEVAELLAENQGGRLQGSFTGNRIQRIRALKYLYESAPLFVRPFALFLYRYLILGGFLDGKEGFIFCVLQTFWFRFLVDAKLYEKRTAVN